MSGWAKKPGDSKTLTVTLRVNGAPVSNLGSALSATLVAVHETGTQESYAMTITPPATVSYTFAASELNIVGKWQAEIRVDHGGGQLITYPDEGAFELHCSRPVGS